MALLSFRVKNIGALFSSSKQSYHWGFHFRQTGENDTDCGEQDWKPLAINLINSSFSHKKTLTVNGRTIIDKEKIQNFAKEPYFVPVEEHGTIQVTLRQVWDSTSDHDFELYVSGQSFTSLMQRLRKVPKGTSLGLFAPITDRGDDNCDYTALANPNKTLYR